MKTCGASVRCTFVAFVALVLTSAGSAHAQCDPQWLPGDGIPGVDGSIAASIMWDPDGAGPLPSCLVVAGDFTHAGTVAASNIAMWDGSSWSPLGTGTDDDIQALAVAANGDLVAAGNFLSAGGVTTSPRIARWNGSAWSGLGNGISKTVYALLAMPNGDIVAGGAEFIVGVAPDQAMCVGRWNGTTWTGLHLPGTYGLQGGTVNALALLPNGDIVAGGGFQYADHFTDVKGLARWNGSSWSLFGNGLNSTVNSMVVTPTGDLIIAGTGSTRVARWDGSTWFSYPGNSWYIIDEIALTPSGDLFAVGYVGAYPNQRGRAAIWNGSQWTNIAEATHRISPISGAMTSITVMPDGNIFTGGNFRIVNGKGADSAAIWNNSSWFALGTGANDEILTTLTLPNGDVIAGGHFLTIGNIAANYIARWNGISWSPIGSGTNAPVYALALLPNGDVVAGGDFTTAGAQSVNRIAKWNGNAWSSLSTGVSGVTGTTQPGVRALAVLPNGDLAVGGNFKTAGSVTTSNIARWDGTDWFGYGTGTAVSAGTDPATVNSIVVHSNGDLVISGQIYTTNGVYSPGVVRWNGSAWLRMGYGFDNGPFAMTVSTDGTLYAGGNFGTAGGGNPGTFRGMARWTSGPLWATSFSTPVNTWQQANVKTMTSLSSNGLVVGGLFSSIGGVSANNIIRRTGTYTWAPLGSGTAGRTPTVNSTHTLGDNEILAAGSFSAAGGQPSGRFARWTDLPKPWILVKPQPQSIVAPDTLTLSATPATAYANVSFQWERELPAGSGIYIDVLNGPGGASATGGTVSGASGTLASPTNGQPATLTITAAKNSDAGLYRVTFWNTCGESSSVPVPVKIKAHITDINADGFVDDFDFVYFATQYEILDCADPSMPDSCSADFNHDGIVDDSDFSIFAPAYDIMIFP